jgi:cell division protein ZapA
MEAKNKRPFEFQIQGLNFKILSSHDEATVRELVGFVDSKINDAMNGIKSGSFQSAAVLAALNIAEELILQKKRALAEIDQIEATASEIIRKIDKSKVATAKSGSEWC